MEILAIQLKSNVAPDKFVGFLHQWAPGWRTSARAGTSSLKLLRTAIPALQEDQQVIVTPEFRPDSRCDALKEFCEVFYSLDRGQWLVWPEAGASES